MKLAIILTNDWELFGNGSGDYYVNQKEPLDNLLQAINDRGFKLTVFAEVIQQWNFLDDAVTDHRARIISKDWEQTINDLQDSGHDVQLHIHPQLIRNLPEKNREWSIAHLNNDDMLKVIVDGKKYLETLIREQHPQYECIAFRAGAYAIQPSQNVLHNLVEAGIKCDSTVTNGLGSSFFNFNHSYSSFFPWYCNTDVRKKNNAVISMLEIPIFSVARIDMPMVRVKFPGLFYRIFHSVRLTPEELQWMQHKTKIKAHQTYTLKDKYQAQASKSIFNLLFYKFIQPNSFQFDYDKIPARVLVKCLEKFIQRIPPEIADKNSDCFIPVVMIGHAKEHYNNDNIIKLMDSLAEKFPTQYQSFTLSDFYHHYTSNATKYELFEKDLVENRLLK